MKYLRCLLLPVSLIYYLITYIRNVFYDKNIFKSYQFHIPTIVVGNLSVGGTGKTPQIEYLIRLFSDKYRVATLSRGYKRKSEGFVLANETTTVEQIGDEPFLFHTKFPNVLVAVDADRVNGIKKLISLLNPPQIVLLDDAFQHRRVKASFYILLTSHNHLYSSDFPLPTGNLRENRSGARRADVVVVTKCPPNITKAERQTIERKLGLNNHQKLFFTYIKYHDFVQSETGSMTIDEVKSKSKLLLAGIANPKPFFDYLKTPKDDTLQFPDHHNFSPDDISRIIHEAKGRIIITTEKDYVRLREKEINNLFYLPIKSEFVCDKEKFDSSIPY